MTAQARRRQKDSEFGAPTNASLLSECPDCTCPSLRGHGGREAASSRQPARMSLPLPTPELAGATSGEGRAPCSRGGPCASRGRRRGGRHPGTAVPWRRQTREVTALDQQDGEPDSGLCCLGRRIRSFVSEQSSQSTSGGGAVPGPAPPLSPAASPAGSRCVGLGAAVTSRLASRFAGRRGAL